MFVAQKAGYNAHGKTAKEAVEDCNFKHLQATVDLTKLKAEIKEAGTINMNRYRLLTGACKPMSEEFCDKNGIKYTQNVPLKEAIALTQGRWGAEKLQEIAN
jgi:hypothetical protein